MSPQEKRIFEFFEFIYDKQKIYHLKEVKNYPPPWARGEILHEYKFNPVYREMDPRTKYLIDTVINADYLSPADKIFNIMLFRRFNTVGFFHDTLPAKSRKLFDQEKWLKKLQFRQESGETLFSDAYLGSPSHTLIGVPKEKYAQQIYFTHTIRLIVSDWDMIIRELKPILFLHSSIKAYTPATGDYLAYLFLQDIACIPEYKRFLEDKINTLIYLNSKSKQSISYIFNHENFLKLSKADYENLCLELYKKQETYFLMLARLKKKKWLDIKSSTPYYDYKFLSLGNIQYNLIDFQKFLSLKYDAEVMK